MNTITAADLLARIEAHLSEGMIWNVDHGSLKDAVTKYTDEARKAAQEVYLAVDYDTRARDGVMSELYYAYAYPATFKSMEKKVAAATKKGVIAEMQGALEAYQAYVRDCAPICERFNALKPLIKKGRKPSTDPTKTARTLDHTGTCPCCFRNIKLIDGKMVRHGYQVQYSQFVGDCFGVGFKPYEISPEGTQAYVDHLKKGLEQAEKRRADLPNVQSFMVKKRVSWVSTVTVEVKIGDEDFPRQMEIAIANADQTIRYYQSDIRVYSEYVAKWEAKPLPDGDKSHMEG